MLKITRTTLFEGFHDSPFLWVPINWSNIALIWSEADILGPGCQSEIKASDITTAVQKYLLILGRMTVNQKQNFFITFVCSEEK